MGGKRLAAAFAALALMAAPAAQAEQWWSLGKTTDGKSLFIDADSLFDDLDYFAVGYRGMFVYDALWTMSDGRTARYEVFEAEIDCEFGELYEYSRAFYGDDRGLILQDQSKSSVMISSGTAADWEANFVCNSAGSWSGYGYAPVSDPVVHARGW